MPVTHHAGSTFEAMKANLQKHLQAMFPIQGKKHRIELKTLEIKDNADPGDYGSQKSARMEGKTWAIPVVGVFELKDLSGKLIHRGRMKIVDLPRLTNRGSYIVGGSEYMFPTQKRLRSGPYVRTGQNNELRTFFNMAKGRNFHLGIHPTKGHFQFQIDTSKNIPLYPLLHALGVSDDHMMRAWGRDVFTQNRVTDGARTTKALKTIFEKMSYGEEAPAHDALPGMVKDIFDETKMDSDNAELVLGKRFDKASGDAILKASEKMLNVARGDEKEDNRDSLIHNDIVDLSDFVVERFNDWKFRSRIQRTIKFNLDRRDKVNQIVSRDAFQRPMDSLFTESQLSQSPIQTNPLGMISDYTAVTVRGEGGIQQDNALTKGLRALDPSHLGFLDPAHTPEGQGVGTTLHLTTATRKRGKDLVTVVADVRTGKEVELTPVQLWKSTVAFPEALDPKTLRLKSKTTKVKTSSAGEVKMAAPKDIDYAFIMPEHLIDVNTASIPFTSHNNGARVMLASKLGVQAKPLLNPEQPLVQTQVAGEKGTVERAVGESFSPRAPISGKVTKVTDDYIQIGTKKVSLPNYFPLNNNNFVHAKAKVKVGDTVKKGQVIADTNYTKDGGLALGKNLRVAYTPYKGINVEDGVVISQGAAEKMTSEHLYQQPYTFDVDTIIDKKKFNAYFPAKVSTKQAAKLDAKGVIKKGSKVNTGDVLVMSMRKQDPGSTESLRMASISRILAKEYRDDSLIWTKEVSGIVQDVAWRPNEIVIHVRTEEPMRVGDKIAGRYANKGVIAHIVPDSDMPQDSSGETIDMLLNPNGVISRMNIGQILETTASRIAEKTGKTFAARSFGDNSTERIAGELKKAGLKDHETIYDPVENQSIPGVLVGKQYIYKLEHQATKKISARGGGADEIYSSEEQPISGREGGRAIGTMELYALLAHGATANVHEMYGIKSSFDPEVWRAIESGAPLPPMRPAFAQQRFSAMLKGMGVDIERNQDTVAVVPFLDRQMKELSSGEITDHKLLRGKDLKEEKNGLFDTKKTGGIKGDRWTHIKLPEPVPNPTFEKAILSITHLKKTEFDDIMSDKRKVNGQHGGRAIQILLDKVDVKKRLPEAKEQAKGKSGSELNALHREIRHLMTLDKQKIKPREYVIERMPVLPPKFRPVYTLPDGSLNVSDVNFHYQSVLQLGQQMKVMKGAEFTDQRKKMTPELYKAVGGVMGLNDGIVERAIPPKGLASMISGRGSPKSGYLHSRLLKKRQDVSATNVIIGNPNLGIDEVGLPEATAWKTFRPFLIKELRAMGLTPLAAKKAIDDKTPQARKVLEKVVSERHVILNRAPTLHKFSVMAFKPRLVPGYALEIPPLIMGGFSADVDGDTMGIHVPISAEANAEAAKMLPSKHLYKPGSKKLQPKIEHEYVLGMFKISRPGKAVAKRYGGVGEVLSDLRGRKIEPNAAISVRSVGPTTPGRVLINESIPTKLRDYGMIWTDKTIQDKLVEIDKVAGRKAFTKALQDFANIGRRYAYLTGSSFLLSDLQSMTKQRNAAYRRADMQAERIRLGSGSNEVKEKKIVDLYMGVSGQLAKKMNLNKNKSGATNNIGDMMDAGARGNPGQVRQMISNIGVLLNHENKAMPEPVRGTYTEGLDSAEFFQHMYGNRKGMIDRSQSVRGPGALTKQVIVSAAGYRVSTADCHTKNGIMEPTHGITALDRHMAEAVKGVGSRGTLVTASVIAAARSKNVDKIRVRSPLTCRAGVGVCSKCYGLDEDGKLPPVGEHVGIKDAQGLTEPSTQLAMRQFHSGGVATGKADLSTGFDRVKQLFTMPDNIHDKALLAEIGGRVEMIRERPQGGKLVTIGGKTHQVTRARKLNVKVGDRVEKGQQLTDGNAQPQDILRLRGLRQMQTQLRDDIHAVYKAGGEHIHHKAIEAPVRMLTETVRISDAGDHPSLVIGDYSTYGRVDDWNRKNRSQRPVKYTHQLPGSEYLPHRSDDWTKRMAHNRIQQVLTEAPAMGAKSKLRGDSPFAALIFGERIKKDPWSQGGLTNG